MGKYPCCTTRPLDTLKFQFYHKLSLIKDPEIIHIWVLIPSGPHNSHMAITKALTISKSLFPHLQSGDDNPGYRGTLRKERDKFY